jgi:hypothetical protein
VKKSLRRVAVTSVAVAVLSAVGAGVAFANSPDDPSGKLINGWGSNTTQDVYNGFTTGFTFNGTTYTPSSFADTVGSWDATNPTTGAINDPVTPVAGGDTFERPDGSGDGRNALSAAWSTTDNSWVSSVSGDTNTLTASATLRHEEITFSRSSSLPGYSEWTNAGVANDLTFLPQAIDAVGVAEAINGNANAVDNLNTAALTAVYTGGTYTQTSGKHTVGDVEESGGYPFLVTAVNSLTGAATLTQVVPVLPEASSGTRSFFLNAIAGTSFSASIVANETGSAAQEENNPSADLSVTNVNAALANDSPAYTVPTNSVEIVPMSGAALIEEYHGLSSITVPSNVSFPTINGDTLVSGTGDSAVIGTLQSAATPDITYDSTLTGNFDRYVWGVVPSSVVVTNDPSGEGALQTWLDQTLESTANQAVWTDYGFKPISTSISDDSSDWITTEFTN